MRRTSKRHPRSSLRHAISGDPLTRILNFGPTRRTVVAATIAALLIQGTAAPATAKAVTLSLDMYRWIGAIHSQIAEALDQEYNIEDLKPPPPVEEKRIEEPKPVEKQPEAKKEESPPPSQPPAAAEAAKVLTQDPDPNTPEDFTNQMVTGTGSTYAGGETRSTGTSKEAVAKVATSPTGVPGGTGTGNVPSVDLSRPPQLSGSSDWKCPWPQEADSEQIDEAFVTIQVTVEADGKASKIAVLSGGDHGFGREARACALRESYKAGLDRSGKPVVATKSFRIHFER